MTDEVRKDTPETPKKQSSVKYYLRIIGTLVAITTVVSVLLAFVNSITAPVIEERRKDTKRAAISDIMPGSDDFDELPIPEGMDTVQDLLEVKKGGEVMGYCIQTGTQGNDGVITLMVGVDPAGTVTKVTILEQSETMHVNKHGELIAQFPGASGSVASTKDGGSINAISGATYTSNAVIAGVNSALTAVSGYVEGGTN